jgi:hypothetical protein
MKKKELLLIKKILILCEKRNLYKEEKELIANLRKS